MEEEMACPVCLDLYEDPLVLPACAHSICRKCLGEIIDSMPHLPRDDDEEVDIFPKCPSCRQQIEVTRDTMHKLPPNLALRNIVCRFREEQEKTDRIQVSSLAATAAVRRTTSAVSQTTSATPCREHMAEKVTMVCDVCNTLVCSLCVCQGQGRHVGHRVLTFRAAQDKMKTKLDQIQRSSVISLSVIESQEEQQKVHQINLQTAVQQTKEKIEKLYSELLEVMTASLDAEKNKVLRKLETATSLVQQNMNFIGKRRKSCQEIYEASGEIKAAPDQEAMLNRLPELPGLTKQLDDTREAINLIAEKTAFVMKDNATNAGLLRDQGDTFFKTTADAVVKTLGSLMTHGSQVAWLSESGPHTGTVEWFGILPGSTDTTLMAGIASDEPVGSGNGKYAGKRLFTTRRNHAVFVPKETIKSFTDLMDNGRVKFGDRVKIHDHRHGVQAGVVKWMGFLPEQNSLKMHVGIDLDNPVGTGRGKYKALWLFETQMNHACLVPLSAVYAETITDDEMLKVR